MYFDNLSRSVSLGPRPLSVRMKNVYDLVDDVFLVMREFQSSIATVQKHICNTVASKNFLSFPVIRYGDRFTDLGNGAYAH